MRAGWARLSLWAIVAWLAVGCRLQPDWKDKFMTAEVSLTMVRNDRIQFATMRPRGSEFAVLDRRVGITGPPEAVAIAEGGNVQHLAALIALLNEPERAWAAEVMLAAMTGREGKIVESYQGNPGEWQDTVGRTAYERWSKWFQERRDRLVWNADERVFMDRPRP